MCDALLPVTMYSFLQTMLMCLGTIGIVISVNPWYEKEGGRERGREGEREGGKEGGRRALAFHRNACTHISIYVILNALGC